MSCAAASPNHITGVCPGLGVACARTDRELPDAARVTAGELEAARVVNSPVCGSKPTRIVCSKKVFSFRASCPAFSSCDPSSCHLRHDLRRLLGNRQRRVFFLVFVSQGVHDRPPSANIVKQQQLVAAQPEKPSQSSQTRRN